MIRMADSPLDVLLKGVLVKINLPSIRSCTVLLLFFLYQEPEESRKEIAKS